MMTLNMIDFVFVETNWQIWLQQQPPYYNHLSLIVNKKENGDVTMVEMTEIVQMLMKMAMTMILMMMVAMVAVVVVVVVAL